MSGVDYHVYRQGVMSGDFILERGGLAVARAEKPSAFHRSFIVEHQTKRYTFRARAMFRRAGARLSTSVSRAWAIWPAHFVGITREYCQIEKLANLEQLPRPHGFYVSCLPVAPIRFWMCCDALAGWRYAYAPWVRARPLPALVIPPWCGLIAPTDTGGSALYP